MSDTDDMPELVDSSEGEETPKMATNLDYVEAWLTSRKKHLGEHHHCIKTFSCGPFLYGFCNNVPKMWITAMHDSKLLVKKNREMEVSPLTKEEWELTDLFTETFSHINPKLKSREHLKSALDAIDEIEKQALISNGNIDVKKAIEKAQDFKAFRILWANISGKTRMQKNPRTAQFCLLYILKNFHYHVLGYGRDGKLVENDIKSVWNKSPEDAESSKEKGNKAFKENKFDLAVRWYTQAIKKDPLNHIFYGNRSQAFLKLRKFREALCDGLRAVTLDHDWAKGYYRYAEAYFELGMLDKAREINHMGRQACQRTNDTLNLRQIDEQRDKFKTEKARLEQIEGNIWNHRGPPDLVSDSNDSEDEDDGAPQLISDSDDNCPPVKSTILRRKQENRNQVLVPFNETLREGSDALEKGFSNAAQSAYHKALEDYTSSEFLQSDLLEADVVVLKYAFGISSVMTGVYSNIMDAINMFKEISGKHPNVKFPAIHYGLGKAYITLNRYEEAHKPVSSGLAVVKNGLKCTGHCWPATDKTIPETKKDKLESLLRELMKVCKYPPTPDAVCRHQGCLEKDKPSIYFSDPDFKGFVRVNCQSMCVVEFHPSCWKAFKTSRTEKASDKEQIDKACPTPDCVFCIQKIYVYRNDSSEPKLYQSDKPPPKSGKTQKKLQKLEPSSQEKISRKAEKKALRKQRRQEARDQKDQEEEEKKNKEEEEELSKSLASQVLQDETELEALAKAETLLYRKEEDTASTSKTKSKSAKQKKKKEKTKQVLNMEVNFTDRRVGEHCMMDDEDEPVRTPSTSSVPVNSENPFSVPSNLQQKIIEFNSVYDNSINPQNNRHNEVANNLFVYFAELLGEHGPLHVNDSILTKELEDFPLEAREVIDTYGGLKGFLQQSLKFGLIEDFVCLLKDAVKARKLVEAYHSKYPGLKPKQFSVAVSGVTGAKPGSVNVAYPAADKTPPNSNVDTSSLNPSASVFTPQPSQQGYPRHVGGNSYVSPVSPCETALEISKLVRSAGTGPRLKTSGYDDLDDFTIPKSSSEKISESKEKTLLENMDDIDDIQLCDDDLETCGTSTLDNLDWSQEQWDDNINSFSRPNMCARNCFSSSQKFENTRPISSIKSDDLDPSRCSSRSSHSELGDLDLGYRTGSPGLQGIKSAYPKIPVQKEAPKDIFSSVSFPSSTVDIFKGSPDFSNVSRKKSPELSTVHPSPLISSSSVNPYDSRPSSCGSPMMSAVIGGAGDGSSSISNIWASDSSTNFTRPMIFSQPSNNSGSPFTSFQDRLTKTAQNPQNPVVTPFSDLPSIPPPITPPISTTWSSSDGLENHHTKPEPFQGSTSSYSLFGGLPGNDDAGFGSQNSSWLNLKQMIDSAVQVDVQRASVGTSTEFDLNSLLAHYKTMQDQQSQMITTLRKAEEDKIALTNTVKQFSMDKMTLEQRNEALLQQILQFEKQIQTLQHLNNRLEETSQLKDVQLEEYRQQKAVESELSARKASQTKSTLVELEHQCHITTERAVSAEKDYLKLKLQVTLQPYNGAKREATFHQHHVSSYVRKCQEEKKDVPTKTRQILSHLASVLETCDTRIVEIKTQYEDNIRRLTEGEMLSSLPPLSVLSPPVPMPAEIASLMAQIFGSGAVSRMPLRLSPTESTPKMIHGPVANLTTPPVSKTNGIGNLAPPKPLQPLGAMSLSKAPMTTAQIQQGLQNGCLQSVAMKPSTPVSNSFEKLIAAMKNIFPNYDRSEVIKLVYELRESRGGSLSGLNLEAIISSISEIVRQRGEVSNIQTSTQLAPPPGLSSSWSFNNSPVKYSTAVMSRPGRDPFMEELNPCAICHEELATQETQGLDCGHIFHTECIRTWFKEQSTCPNCRVHALLADDFPSLK